MRGELQNEFNWAPCLPPEARHLFPFPDSSSPVAGPRPHGAQDCKRKWQRRLPSVLPTTFCPPVPGNPSWWHASPLGPGYGPPALP